MGNAITQERFEIYVGALALVDERLKKAEEELKKTKPGSRNDPVFENLFEAFELACLRSEVAEAKALMQELASRMAEEGMPMDSWVIHRRDGEEDVKFKLASKPRPIAHLASPAVA